MLVSKQTSPADADSIVIPQSVSCVRALQLLQLLCLGLPQADWLPEVPTLILPYPNPNPTLP